MSALSYVPVIAETDLELVIGFIVALLYGAFWLIRKMGESKGQQQRLAERDRERKNAKNEEAPGGYVADDQQVRQFLETLGTQAEAKPAPPRAPQPARPAPANAPGRPPQRRLQPKPEPPLLAAATPVTPEPPAAAPRPKARAARGQRQAQQLEPEQEYAFGSPAARPDHPETPQTSDVHRHVAAAQRPQASEAAAPADPFAFPKLTPLQRAIVLSDILGRRPGTPGRSRR